MENRTSVKGILHNQQGQPISDAIIMIANSSHSHQDMASVSNENGEFYLSNIVVPGEYTLEIRADANMVQKELTISNGQTIHITF